MKKIILDTDIGIDCDDAAAIGMLLQLEEEGKCFVEGITTCTTREGGGGDCQGDYPVLWKR